MQIFQRALKDGGNPLIGGRESEILLGLIFFYHAMAASEGVILTISTFLKTENSFL